MTNLFFLRLSQNLPTNVASDQLFLVCKLFASCRWVGTGTRLPHRDPHFSSSPTARNDSKPEEACVGRCRPRQRTTAHVLHNLQI